MARTVSRSPCHRLLVGLSCKLLCFLVVATCGNTSNEITWSHGPQIALQNRFKLRTAAMSIVGSLLSQLRSKLGARFSRHVGVKRICSACTLIRFPDLMAILQIRTPHLPMSLRCGEKKSAKLKDEFVCVIFSKQCFCNSSNRQQSQDIDHLRSMLKYVEIC
jgi:hypothetical protein